jgi:uncharacterized membrane protein YeaQ/YmgE (transglycosylase-associated protein family)
MIKSTNSLKEVSMVIGIVYWTLMIGFLIGALAKFFFHSMKQGEVFATMTSGLIGSVFFGWLGGSIGLYNLGETDGLIASLTGAIFAVIIYCLYYKRTTRI